METQEKKENDYTKQIGLGLLKLPPDRRYFKITKLLGTVDLAMLPDEFIADGAKDLKVKNQGMTLWCTAYSGTTASGLQEKTDLSPAYQAAKIAQVRGESRLRGATNKDAAKSLIEFGSLEENDPITRAVKGNDNPASWAEIHDQKARKHRKKAYFLADGYNSTFDALRACIWQNRAQRCVVMSGGDWRNSWTVAKDGIIPEEYGDRGFPHAFVIIGWKGNHLICHLSNGKAIGNEGIFYMPRVVANKELVYGNLLLVDIDPEEAKKRVWSIRRRFYEAFLKYISEIFK